MGSPDGGVDEKILSELFELMGEGGAEGLVEVCEMFLTGVPARLADAESAVREGRYEDAGRVAHSLRGTAGTFGAARLSLLADRMEGACGESDGQKADSLIGESRDEFEIFAAFLKTRLKQATAG